MLYTMRSQGADKLTAWFWLKYTVLMAFLILLNEGGATDATWILPKTQNRELKSYMKVLKETFPEKSGKGHTIGETEKLAAKFYSSVFASHPHPFEENALNHDKAFATEAKRLTEHIKSILLDPSDVDLNAVLQVLQTVIARTNDPIEGYQRIICLTNAFGLVDPKTNSVITTFIQKHQDSYTKLELNELRLALEATEKTDTAEERIEHFDILIEELKYIINHHYMLRSSMLGNDIRREKYKRMGANMFWMLLQMCAVYGKMCKTAHNKAFANKLVEKVDDLLSRFPK